MRARYQHQIRPNGLNFWPRELPVVMAILNCTPDSFYERGRTPDIKAALKHAKAMISEGADIIDIGGESTRPGADTVDAATEKRRVLPVINEIKQQHPDIIISIDTNKTDVADATLDAGADIVNDVSAGNAEGMFECVAAHDATMILMHMRGTCQSMQDDTKYTDVVADVHEYLAGRAKKAISAGIAHHQIWLDPGIGFGKDDPGNLKLLSSVPDLAALGFPVVVGASRKSFIGRITGAAVDNRLPGSFASLIPCLRIARLVVRVHDPGPTKQFLRIASSINRNIS